MNESFDIEYSILYDALYKDKDYKSEVIYVDSIIDFHKKEPVKTIVDVGCGTGNHIFYFNQLCGYRVTGIDKSLGMLQCAKMKHPFSFLHSDELTDNPVNDVAVSLFDVFSYQTTEEQIQQYFSSINKVLKPGGLFLFEYWNGLGCAADPPKVTVKKFISSLGDCTRIAIPCINKSKIDVEIICFIETPKGIQKIKEIHKLRTFTIDEIKVYLSRYGFEMIHNYGWSKTVFATDKDYHAFCVCRRNK